MKVGEPFEEICVNQGRHPHGAPAEIDLGIVGGDLELGDEVSHLAKRPFAELGGRSPVHHRDAVHIGLFGDVLGEAALGPDDQILIPAGVEEGGADHGGEDHQRHDPAAAPEKALGPFFHAGQVGHGRQVDLGASEIHNGILFLARALPLGPGQAGQREHHQDNHEAGENEGPEVGAARMDGGKPKPVQQRREHHAHEAGDDSAPSSMFHTSDSCPFRALRPPCGGAVPPARLAGRLLSLSVLLYYHKKGKRAS